MQGSEDTRNKTILTFTTVQKAVLPKTKEEEEEKKKSSHIGIET